MRAACDEYRDYLINNRTKIENADGYYEGWVNEEITARYGPGVYGHDMREIEYYEANRMGLSPVIYTVTVSAGGGQMAFPNEYTSTGTQCDRITVITQDTETNTVINYGGRPERWGACLAAGDKTLVGLRDGAGNLYTDVELSNAGGVEYYLAWIPQILNVDQTYTAVWE